MTPVLTEQEQFELLKAGNKDAYAYFFIRHNDGIYNYFRALGADGDLAKDLSQEAFKRLWDLRGNLHGAQHLAAYLYVMARHLFLDHLRKIKIVSAAARDLAYAASLEAGRNKELEIVCQRVVLEMKAAMQTLSAKRRLVLQLMYLKGLDVVAIAQLLRLSPQTVRNHKAQATAFLRAKLYDRELVMPLVLSIFLRYLEEQ